MIDKVSPGQRLAIPARRWNGIIDMHNVYEEQRRLGQGGNVIGDNFLSGLLVRVKNSTGSDQARGRALELGDLIVDDPANDFMWFDGTVPSDTSVPFGILRGALPNGDIGEAFVSGACISSVDVQNTTHAYATIAKSSSTLKSTTMGSAVILANLTSTGVQEVPVLLGGFGKKQLVRFTLNAVLATTDASKAATITHQYGPGMDADTATAITVHNLLTHTAGTYVFEGDSGDAGLAMWDSGTNYRIIQMECA